MQQDAAKPPITITASYPTTIPNGFKHPNQLKERGVPRGPPPTSVREGTQEGLHSWAVQGNNITPSVTNRFISDGMKYSSQIHLSISSMRVILLATQAFTNSQKQWLFISNYLPPTSQHSRLANYAFKSSSALKKKNYCSYTASQLIKVKEKPEVKFASKKFQDEHEEQGTWKR